MVTGTIQIALEDGKIPQIDMKGNIRARDIPMLQRRIFQAFRLYAREVSKLSVAAKKEAREAAGIVDTPKVEQVIEQTSPEPQFVPKTTIPEPEAFKPGVKLNQFSREEANTIKPESEGVEDEGQDNTGTVTGSTEGSGHGQEGSPDAQGGWRGKTS